MRYTIKFPKNLNTENYFRHVIFAKLLLSSSNHRFDQSKSLHKISFIRHHFRVNRRQSFRGIRSEIGDFHVPNGQIVSNLKRKRLMDAFRVWKVFASRDIQKMKKYFLMYLLGNQLSRRCTLAIVAWWYIFIRTKKKFDELIANIYFFHM